MSANGHANKGVSASSNWTSRVIGPGVLPEITAHIHFLYEQGTSNILSMTFIVLTIITEISTQMVTENGYIMTRTDKNWRYEINVYRNLSEFFAEANVEAFQSTVQVRRIEFWDKL